MKIMKVPAQIVLFHLASLIGFAQSGSLNLTWNIGPDIASNTASRIAANSPEAQLAVAWQNQVPPIPLSIQSDGSLPVVEGTITNRTLTTTEAIAIAQSVGVNVEVLTSNTQVTSTFTAQLAAQSSIQWSLKINSDQTLTLNYKITVVIPGQNIVRSTTFNLPAPLTVSEIKYYGTPTDNSPANRPSYEVDDVSGYNWDAVLDSEFTGIVTVGPLKIIGFYDDGGDGGGCN